MEASETPGGARDHRTGTIEPKQKRGREAADRIVAAAIELLGEDGLATVSVAEIARQAGVSIGSFYARFTGKDALLCFLQGDLMERAVATMRAALSPEAASGLGARDVIRRYVSIAVETFRNHRSVLRQISLHSRTSQDPGFRHQIQQVNVALHGVFRERMHERLEAADHPEPKRAVDIGLTAVSAVMREYVLFDDFRDEFEPVPDPALIDELTDLFSSYLRLAQ